VYDNIFSILILYLTTQSVATLNIAEQSQASQQTNIQSQIQSDQTIQTKQKKRVSIPTERMITRTASGAINPKTVDEILTLKEAEVYIKLLPNFFIKISI
jgi:hypothetical protein